MKNFKLITAIIMLLIAYRINTVDAQNPLRLRSDTVYQIAGGDTIGFYLGDTVGYIGTVNDIDLQIMQGDTAAITIRDNEWVGIGTTNPVKALELGGTAETFYMNSATSNLIRFNSAGVSLPSLASTPAGAKIVLSPLAGGSADYAIGIGSGILWYGVPTSAEIYSHKWYGGTTEAMSLDATNGLELFNTGATITEFSTDGTMAGNSDDAVPTEKAVVTYVGTTGASLQTNVNQLGDSLRSELTDTASSVRQFTIDNRNYFDVTICASGCDYSDISTAFSTEPSGTSFYVANESFTEGTAFTIDQDRVYWDGTVIHWATSNAITVTDSVKFSGSLKISCTTASAGGNMVINITGNFNELHPCPVLFSIEDTMSKSRFFDIDGNYNTVNTSLDTGLVFSSTGCSGAFFAIDGNANRLSINCSETQHTATPTRSMLNVDGDYNSIDIIAVNNYTAAGSITGVTLSATAEYNSVRGVTYGNATANLTDAGSPGTGNNTSGLVAP